MNETLNEKIDLVKQVKDFLVNQGLNQEEAVNAILDAEIISMIEWESNCGELRAVEEYAAEAYEAWKVKQD